MRVVVVSDTHAPRFWKGCPPAVARHLEQAEVILHAGDVCTPEVLDELARWAPVHVVRGNNDGPDIAAWGAPDRLEIELVGVSVGMIHDSGPSSGRSPRMRRQFPGARLVVFGHSHIPLLETTDDFTIFNPGSPTDKRRQPYATLGLLDLVDGRIDRAEILPLPPRG